MPSTTAIRHARTAWIAVAIAIGLPAFGAAADGIDRLLATLAAYRPSVPMLDATELRARCGGNTLCAAQQVVARLGPPSYLEPVTHPDSDSIRMVRTAPSLTAHRLDADGLLYLRLDRFGRKAVAELTAAVAEKASQTSLSGYALDLRGNRGGDLDRMLRVAALFIGPRPRALSLHGTTVTALDVPASAARLPVRPLRVLIGGGTASSAEILAALLRRHGNAELAGAPSAGKTYLYRIVPVDHDWRLMLAAERFEVPGETLQGGLEPDTPIVR